MIQLARKTFSTTFLGIVLDRRIIDDYFHCNVRSTSQSHWLATRLSTGQNLTHHTTILLYILLLQQSAGMD